jgi:type I restriction enzyme R subunit
MPNITVTPIVINAFYNRLNGINLIRAHHHQFLLTLHQNHIAIFKSLQISPRRAMQQIIKYKNDEGNGYINTLLCFMQLFIVSNHTKTWYFANNNTQHFDFDADEKLAMKAVFSIDAKLINHLKSIFTPILDINQCVM